MSSTQLVKAAQEATRDATLMASLIGQFGEQEGLVWSQIAARLHLGEEQLARLALCRRPRDGQFQEDVAQIADYAGMDRRVLAEFVRQGVISPVLNAGLGARETKKSRAARGRDRVAKAAGGRDNTMLRSRVWIAGAVAVALVLVAVFAFAQPEQAGATLVVTDGQATVVQAKSGARAILAGPGMEVAAGEAIAVGTGDSITLGDGSAAQLRLLDGSTVDLYGGTAVDVAELVDTPDTYRVRLAMSSGRTISRVRRLLGVGDRFEISTPSSSASVRGTVFIVEVIDPVTTYYACDEGVVLVQMGGRAAEVQAGEELLAVVRESLDVLPQVEESVAVALEPDDPGEPAASAAAGAEAPTDEAAAPDSSLPEGAPAASSGDTSGAPSGDASAPSSEGTSALPPGDAAVPASGDTSAPPPVEEPAPPPTAPPPTATPVPPPTDVPTPVPTNTPLPTDTPVPPPTEPPFSCSDISLAYATNGRFRVNNNSSSTVITLTNVSLGWPASNGALQLITLQGTIWTGSAAPPSANISLSGSASARQIPAGQQRILTFGFESGIAGTGYSVTLTFDVGCAVSGSG